MTSFRTITLATIGWVTCSLFTAQAGTPDVAREKRGRIVVIGDSITAGYGLEPEQAYPALLQKRLADAGFAQEVVNAGVSGDTTSGGLRRVEWAISRGVDVLIVALGGNDGLRGIAPKQAEANIAGIIQKTRAKAPRARIIVAGMQMPASMGKAYVEEFAALFPRVAKAQRAELVSFLLEGVGGIAELNQPDLIHPTAEGQKRIAETVWPVLEKVLRQSSAEGASSGGR